MLLHIKFIVRKIFAIILLKHNVLFLAASDHFPIGLRRDTFLFFEAANEIT